jgi:hypothetical protein
MNATLKMTLFAAAAAAAAASLASSASADRTGHNADALARAQSATAKYQDLAVAKANGYTLLKDAKGIACIQMTGMPQMGAMGVHFANGKLVGDGAISATKPEALVYEPKAGGKMQLVALEYVVLKSAWDAKHASAPSLFGQQFNFTPAGNRYGLPAFYSLHAWIWKQNPSGTFAMWNPTVSCAAA